MPKAWVVLLLLTRRMPHLIIALVALGAICILALQFDTTPAPSPVGWWKSSGYPSSPPTRALYLEIRKGGEYSYESLPGHGTWTMHGDHLKLNAYQGAKGEEFTVESKFKELRNTATDGVDFLPMVGKPQKR